MLMPLCNWCPSIVNSSAIAAMMTATGFDPAIKKDGSVLEDGYLGLQAESQPVEFRKIRLLNLSGCMNPDSPAYRTYFARRDDARCTSR